MLCDLVVMQGVNGVFKMGSPTSSDDDSIKSFKLELEESMAKQQQDWAEQLAEQQRLVQQWQDESWKITLSLEQKELDLDEALEREQGLQSSLTSLQHHMDRHEHLIVIPTSRLVSPCLPRPFLRLQRPLVAAGQ